MYKRILENKDVIPSLPAKCLTLLPLRDQLVVVINAIPRSDIPGITFTSFSVDLFLSSYPL